MKQKSLFGSNFKYVLLLTAFAWLVYNAPSVKASIQAPLPDNVSGQTAALFDVFLKKSSNMVASGTQQYGMKKRVEMEMMRPEAGRPADIISILSKLGYISADKVEQAKIDVRNYLEVNKPLPPGIEKKLNGIQVGSTTATSTSANNQGWMKWQDEAKRPKPFRGPASTGTTSTSTP